LDALTNLTRYQLDDQGRLLQQVNADGGIESWARDSAGRVSNSTDALGRQTTCQRDAQGYVTLETLPDTHTREKGGKRCRFMILRFSNDREAWR
jgi:YD repeat-containing protein